MIVVDANVIAYLLIVGDKTELAQAAWQRDPHWITPALWRHELLNILATYVRSNAMPLDAALNTWRQAVTLLAPDEEVPSLELALMLAASHQISANDAQYIALSREKGLPLLSEDRALQRKFPETVRSLAEFCA
jgi:predicted nucleic acid-binding protein